MVASKQHKRRVCHLSSVWQRGSGGGGHASRMQSADVRLRSLASAHNNI